MSFCEHCAGQRFDRAQVLRLLRATRRDLKRSRPSEADAALAAAIKAVQSMDIPHIEFFDEVDENEVLH